MKPSWDIAPEWAQWLAQDMDGQWSWYEVKPLRDSIFWFAKSHTKSFLIHDSAKFEWKDSLQERPHD